MKIIISPAKIQKPRGFSGYEATSLLYQQTKNEIHNNLIQLDKASIGKSMKIKGSLLDQTFDQLHLDQDIYTAIDLYSGIVFKEMNIFSYDPIQLDYMERHLRILSAYYGILNPSTGIKPYRLDLTMKFKNLNLIKLWKHHINDYFEGEVILNLASKEFSSLIDHPMINVHFKEEQSDGSLKVVTVRAKKARGLMVNYMVEHVIEDLQAIKAFDEMGYKYSKDHSDEHDWTFILKYE